MFRYDCSTLEVAERKMAPACIVRENINITGEVIGIVY